MELHRWLCYIFLKYLVVQYLNAKTVSLNEIIKAEAKLKQEAVELQPSKLTDPEVTSKIPTNENKAAVSQSRKDRIKSPTKKLTSFLKRLPLFKRLESNSKFRSLRKDRDTLTRKLLEGKNLSLQRYRKEFQIRSPLKPKKLRLGQNSRRKQKNQSTKREITGNDNLKQKYVPLLKSLNMLFDHIIGADVSDSNPIKTKNYKRNRFYSGELFAENQSKEDGNFRIANSKSQKKTTAAAPSVSTEISSDTENLSNSEDHDYSTVRPNKSIPLLLSRNTISSRRDNNGSSKGSRSSYNRNIKGNITRDYGTHGHNTRFRKNKTNAGSGENYSDGTTRNDTSSIGYRRTGRDRNNTQNSRNNETIEFIKQGYENAKDVLGKDQFKNRGDKNESKIVLREPIRGLRGYTTEGEIAQDETTFTKFVQNEKLYEESVLSSANVGAGNKRVIDKNGTNTTKDEKNGPRNETIIVIESYYPQTESYSEGKSKIKPAILIYDGYSITRDKNGENKVTGKTIHVHS